MARGLSAPGEQGMSALQGSAYCVAQRGCHLAWLPQEHSRNMVTPEVLGPPRE